MAFYRTDFRVSVLSDGPVVFDNLQEVHDAITEGHCLGIVDQVHYGEISAKRCANLCYEFGSDPGFFMLNDAGQATEE